MRKSVFIMLLCIFSFSAGVVHGQQLDAAFGLSTIESPSAASATGDHFPQKLGSGAFPVVTGDFVMKNHFGASAEVSWRASQALYQGVSPYRPIFYDFNGMYERQFGKRLGVEVMAGFGAESIRFYQNFVNCSFTGCTNYSSSNHFMGDVGGGVRLYLLDSIFIRPEARFYMIHNNVEFSGSHAARLGISVGYTFGLKE